MTLRQRLKLAFTGDNLTVAFMVGFVVLVVIVCLWLAVYIGMGLMRS